MKSENACERKSLSTEFPGPLPTMLEEAMAMLACATWASLSRSTSCGATGLEFINLSIRAFQVSALWNIFSAMFGLSCSCSTFSVSVFSGLLPSSPLSCPTIMIPAKAVTMTIMPSPTSLPIWFIGTRPMSIMAKIVILRSMAVDKFSSPMRPTNGVVATSMNLKAFLLAP